VKIETRYQFGEICKKINSNAQVLDFYGFFFFSTLFRLAKWLRSSPLESGELPENAIFQIFFISNRKSKTIQFSKGLRFTGNFYASLQNFENLEYGNFQSFRFIKPLICNCKTQKCIQSPNLTAYNPGNRLKKLFCFIAVLHDCFFCYF